MWVRLSQNRWFFQRYGVHDDFVYRQDKLSQTRLKAYKNSRLHQHAQGCKARYVSWWLLRNPEEFLQYVRWPFKPIEPNLQWDFLHLGQSEQLRRVPHTLKCALTKLLQRLVWFFSQGSVQGSAKLVAVGRHLVELTVHRTYSESVQSSGFDLGFRGCFEYHHNSCHYFPIFGIWTQLHNKSSPGTLLG